MLRILKKIFSFMFSRLFLVVIMLMVQIVLLITLIVLFSMSAIYMHLLFTIFSFAAVMFVVSNYENPSYKLTWIIVILTFPLTGWVFYLMFGNKRMPSKLKKRIDSALEDTKLHMPFNYLAEERLLSLGEDRAAQSMYVYNIAGSPAFENTSSKYFPVGELMYHQILTELETAKEFIFLEFFIIRPGAMWDSIFKILKQKAAAGIDVYMIYDDIGCINTMTRGRAKEIRDAGVRICIFNPFRPRISMIMNYRDHRKLIVIDGKTAFCGGINIADEYINAYERFGHWKDTGVMLKGEAVWPLTFMFLQMWQFATDEHIDFNSYWKHDCAEASDGLVQPFGDTPLDRYNTTETAFLNIIYRAKRYVYITTPYLVIGNEMMYALCSAAQSGVDVRIITPYIYDKWYVHLLTQSHYPQLIKAGVKIYEYLPGFMHGKMFLSDDEICMVGTCNMDFRSLYLHFECSVVFYQSSLISDVKKDMLDCQQLSSVITLDDVKNVPARKRIARSFLRIFAPLM